MAVKQEVPLKEYEITLKKMDIRHGLSLVLGGVQPVCLLDYRHTRGARRGLLAATGAAARC